MLRLYAQTPGLSTGRTLARNGGDSTLAPVLSLDTQLLEAGLDPGLRAPQEPGVGRVAFDGLDHQVELDFRCPALLGAQVDRRIERIDAVTRVRDPLQRVKRHRAET